MKEISPCFFGVTKENSGYQISYEITNVCNLKCKHCCNSSSLALNQGLTKSEIFNLVDDLKDIKTNSIYLTGGEPTTLPFFKEVLKYINFKGIKVVLATNGFDIGKYIKEIKKYASHEAGVFVSLDGIKETHDGLRGVDGAFKKAEGSIKLLIDNGISTRISTVVWGKNINELERLIKFAKSLGVYQIHFSMLFNSGRTSENKHITIKENEYKSVIKRVHELINKYSTDNFVVSARRDYVLDAESDYCRGGEKLLHINSIGKIFPCSWSEKCQLGKIYGAQWRKGNIKECVKKVNDFQNLVRKRKELFGYSGCPAMAASYHGDEFKDDPLNELLK